MLDERHRLTIRQFERACSANELRSLWRAARDRGDIPGAYWAALSATLSGRKNGETFTVSLSTAATPTSPVGTYAVTIDSLSGPLANGIVLAGCGQWPNATPDTYFYSATSNTWSAVGALNEPRRNQAGYQIGTRMVVLGGYDCPGNTCLTDPTTTSELGKGAVSAARPGFTRPTAGSSSGKASTT